MRTCHAVSLLRAAANDAEPDEWTRRSRFAATPGYMTRLPSANPRAAASALSSGLALKAIAAPEALVRTALTTTSNEARPGAAGGRLLRSQHNRSESNLTDAPLSAQRFHQAG